MFGRNRSRTVSTASRRPMFERLESRDLMATIDFIAPAGLARPAASDDGRYITYSQERPDSYQRDIFVLDQQTGGVTQANLSATGQPSATSIDSDISNDGRYVVFQAPINGLLSETATGTESSIYRKDLQTGAVVRVSVTQTGELPNNAPTRPGNPGSPSISGDGRFVVFSSGASNLAPDDTNEITDLFLKDLVTGELELITRTSSGTLADGISYSPEMSSDGKWVTFTSHATNLDPADADADSDVFLYSVATKSLSLVSSNAAGEAGDGYSSSSTISADGSKIAFWSDENNLVPNDTNSDLDVFVKDVVANTIVRANTRRDGGQTAGSKFAYAAPSLSSDGNRVAFASQAAALTAGDTNNRSDVFIKTLSSGHISRVSRTAEDGLINVDSTSPMILGQGSVILFETKANAKLTVDTPTQPSFAPMLYRIHSFLSPEVKFGKSSVYIGSSPPMPVAPNLRFIDDVTFSSWNAEIAIVENADVADQLSIRHQGTGAGQVGVSGNNITYGGTTVGTFSGGTGTTPLQITLTSDITLQAMQAILRNVTFRSTTATNEIVTRSVRFTVTDADGATSIPREKNIVVRPANIVPTLILSGSVTYGAGSAPRILTPNASIENPGRKQFGGGKLAITESVGGDAGDRISIQNAGTAANQIGVSDKNVLYGGVVIGTAQAAIGTTPGLDIALNFAATPEAVQALFRNVTFATASATTPFRVRTMSFVLDNGAGKISNTAVKTVEVLPSVPVVSLGEATANAKINQQLKVAPNATITIDPRFDFHGGQLAVAIQSGELFASVIDVDSSKFQHLFANGEHRLVNSEGVIIGRFGFGQPAYFVVDFTDQVKTSEVESLLRSVVLRTGAGVGRRTVEFTILDGHGNLSDTVTKTFILTK